MDKNSNPKTEPKTENAQEQKPEKTPSPKDTSQQIKEANTGFLVLKRRNNALRPTKSD